MQDEIKAKLAYFTRTEDDLMKRLKATGATLPYNLAHWRLWIGDSAIYLNMLREFVEREEQKPKPVLAGN